MDRVKYIVNIAIVAMLFIAVAIGKDGKILGNKASALIENTQNSSNSVQTAVNPVEEILADGTRIINTASIAKNIVGFAGATPVKVHIKGNKIIKVELEDNSETPSFINRVTALGLLNSWDDVDISNKNIPNPDAISGATYSSDAIIANVDAAIRYANSVSIDGVNTNKPFDLKAIIGMLVILLGVVITFIKPKSRLFVTIQMVLNVAVLGFWCGSFLSLSQITSWMANGFNLSVSLLTTLLLFVALIMPLFKRKGSYCAMHCPMGSLQEIVNLVPIANIRIAPKLSKLLSKLRYYILLALLFLMWIGVGFNIMDYEIFSAFIVESASTIVLVMAAIFVILSLFIRRPYCRFVCPTGALLTIMQRIKE